MLIRNLLNDNLNEKVKIGTVPYIEIGDINIETKKYSLKDKGAVGGAKYAYKNNILVSTVRPTRGAITIVNENKIAVSSAFTILNVNEKICNYRFLFYYLNNENFFEYLGSNSKGATYPTCSKDDVLDYEIILPDIDTQNKIVSLFDNITKNIFLKNEQINLCNNLIKSQFVEMFGNYDLTTNLSKYIKELRGGKSLAGTEVCINKVLKTGAATFGWFDSNQFKYLPKNYIPLEEHKVETGDVIISRMNTPELVGACSYVFKAPDNMYYPDRLWKTILKDNNNPIFLWQLLWDDKIRKQIKENSAGTSGTMQNISKQKLLEIKCIDAPIELQNKFAKIVEQIDKQKFEFENSLKKLEELQASLMQEYFG